MFIKNNNNKLSITSTDNLHQIETLIHQLSTQSPYQRSATLIDIFSIFFGNHLNKGIISILADEAYKTEPVEWIKKMEQLMNYIGPPSIHNQLKKQKMSWLSRILSSQSSGKRENVLVLEWLDNKHLRQTIQKSNLPSHLQINDLQESYPSLDIKSNYQEISVPTLEWYFMNIVSKIYQYNQPNTPDFGGQALIIDDFYFHLTRNPLLVLLRRNFQYFQKSPQKATKLTDIMKMYLVEGLVVKYQQKNSLLFKTQKNKNYRFQLKPTAILALFIGIKYRRQDFSNLEIYFQSAIEFYTSINSNNDTLRYLIRLWLFYIGAWANCQERIFSNLYKANSIQGFYLVFRYNLQQQKVSSKEFKKISNFSAIYEGILGLLKYEDNWCANFNYLYTLASFIIASYDKKSGQRRYIDEKNKQKQMGNIFNTIVHRFKKNNVIKKEQETNKKYPQVKQKYDLNNKQDRQLLIRNIQSNFSNIIQKKASQYNIESTKKNLNQSYETKMLTFHRSSDIKCWDYPINYNQSYILFHIFKFIATQITKVIRLVVHKQEPINIRFLANPLLLTIILLVLYLTMIFIS